MSHLSCPNCLQLNAHLVTKAGYFDLLLALNFFGQQSPQHWLVLNSKALNQLLIPVSFFMTPYNHCRIGAFHKYFRQSLEHLFVFAFSSIPVGKELISFSPCPDAGWALAAWAAAVLKRPGGLCRQQADQEPADQGR